MRREDVYRILEEFMDRTRRKKVSIPERTWKNLLDYLKRNNKPEETLTNIESDIENSIREIYEALGGEPQNPPIVKIKYEGGKLRASLSPSSKYTLDPRTGELIDENGVVVDKFTAEQLRDFSLREYEANEREVV